MAAACEIWNQVVDDGEAFPQEEDLTEQTGNEFFMERTYTGIAEDTDTGEKLVLDCLRMAKEKSFRVLQFNAVVASNTHALHLYKRIGFTPLGVIPGGFRMNDGHYEDIIPHYYVL